MLERLKQAMVESFVGAIALGWLFAQGVIYFVDVFSAPVGAWIARSEYRGLLEGNMTAEGILLRDAVPDLIKSICLLLVWYVLLRWLYFTPLKREAPEQTPNPGLSA